ncbi:MAG: LysR family transcriptional regulator [Motiliproteus sp.]
MSKRVTFSGQVSDFDIRLLRVFKVVVESGGFSAAEPELNITGPAISMAMSDLETRLGFRLCLRGRSGFSLTDEGLQVYESILRLFSSLEGFRDDVDAINTHLKGELNVGMTDNLVTLFHMHITNAISALTKREPHVRIHIRMMPPKDIEQAVLEGTLHVGAVPDIRPLPGLDYSPLYEEQLLLYCGENHPLFHTEQDKLAPADITEHRAIVLDYVEQTDMPEACQELHATAKASDREGVAVLILSGSYIGFLPTHYAKQWVDAGRMKPLLPSTFAYKINYSAVVRKGGRQHRILEAFMDELKIILKT